MPETPSTIDNELRGTEVPAGYCPHCDYQINPGVCPECGAAVETHQIRATPRPIRRRKWIKRGAFAAVALVLFFSGRSLYRSTIWWSWVPTSYLIAHAPSNGWEQTELLNRLKNGTLSRNELIEYFEKSYPTTLDVRSPHPYGENVLVKLDIGHAPKIPFDTIFPGREFTWSELYVDGMPNKCSIVWTIGTPLYGSGDGLPQTLCNVLEAGKHELTAKGTVTYDFKLTESSPSLPGFPITILWESHTSIEVVNEPLSTFVNGEYNQSLGDDIAGSIQLAIFNQRDGMLAIYIDHNRQPITVAGYLRLYDSVDRSLIGESRVTIRRSLGQSSYIPHIKTKQIIGNTKLSVHVEFVPDLMIAFDSRSDTYFAGQIRWNGVNVVQHRLGDEGFEIYRSASWISDYLRHPDSVTEWKPEGNEK